MKNPVLHYKSFGDDNNPAVIILLHGMLGSMDNWRSQAKRLSSHFRVITPDLRNHGRSPHVSGMRYQDMAQDVLTLSDQLGLTAFDLLGHSMGGKIAMEIALHHASSIKRLAIVDIAPKPYALWHLATFKALLSLPVAELSTRSQADNRLSQYIEDPFERAFLLKNLKSRSSGGYEWRCNLKEITRAYLNIANFTEDADTQFEGRTLFIKGETSPYIDAQNDPATIATFFPTASLQIIAKAGHNPHVENADAFYNVMSQFLGITDTE